MKLILERSRVENKMMKRIKAKEDLFKKLQDLDEKRLDLSEIKENEDSLLEPSSAADDAYQ